MEINTQELRDKEDLELLLRGDAIERKDGSNPLGDSKNILGAYHKRNHVGHFEFVFPAFCGEEYIIMDRVRKDTIEVIDGKVVYDRDLCAVESFSQLKPEYDELNKTLQMAGLR